MACGFIFLIRIYLATATATAPVPTSAHFVAVKTETATANTTTTAIAVASKPSSFLGVNCETPNEVHESERFLSRKPLSLEKLKKPSSKDCHLALDQISAIDSSDSSIMLFPLVFWHESCLILISDGDISASQLTYMHRNQMDWFGIHSLALVMIEECLGSEAASEYLASTVLIPSQILPMPQTHYNGILIIMHRDRWRHAWKARLRANDA